MDANESIHASKQPRRPHYIPEWAEKRGLTQAGLSRELGADKSTALAGMLVLPQAKSGKSAWRPFFHAKRHRYSVTRMKIGSSDFSNGAPRKRWSGLGRCLRQLSRTGRGCRPIPRNWSGNQSMALLAYEV
jgi:hypothetical protein